MLYGNRIFRLAAFAIAVIASSVHLYAAEATTSACASIHYQTADTMAISDTFDVDPHFNSGTYQKITEAVNGDMRSSIAMVAGKVALRITMTNITKKAVHEWRPDGSSDNSFPSRHAVWAYGVAGSIGYATADYWPEIPVAMHTLANAVGMQRVMARRHWPGDVMAGASFGITIDLGVRSIVDCIFHTDSKHYHPTLRDENSIFGLSAATGMYFPLHRDFGEYRLTPSFTSDISFSAQISHRLQAEIAAQMMSAPIKLSGSLPAGTPVAGAANSLSVYIGPSVNLCRSTSPWSVNVEAQAGYRHNFASGDISVGGDSPALRAGVETSVFLTPRFSLGLAGNYGTARLRIGDTKLADDGFGAYFTSRVVF